MKAWSLVVGIVGLLMTAALMVRLCRSSPRPEVEKYWLLGLAAFFPAWLLALMGLLGTGNFDSPTYSPPRSVIFSSASALIGVIVSDFFRRRLAASGAALSPAMYWLLGVAAFLAGWVVALWSLR